MIRNLFWLSVVFAVICISLIGLGLHNLFGLLPLWGAITISASVIVMFVALVLLWVAVIKVIKLTFSKWIEEIKAKIKTLSAKDIIKIVLKLLKR